MFLFGSLTPFSDLGLTPEVTALCPDSALGFSAQLQVKAGQNMVEEKKSKKEKKNKHLRLKLILSLCAICRCWKGPCQSGRHSPERLSAWDGLQRQPYSKCLGVLALE